jgi:AAA15 family ATPase/GTPase
MENLQWIEIKNFRGIKHAKLENFTSINVFIGRNNTGKSTLLEAIYLNALWCHERRKWFYDFFGHVCRNILEKKRKRKFDEYWAYKKRFPIEISSNISKLVFQDISWTSSYSESKKVVFLYPELCIDPEYPLFIRNYLADLGFEVIEKIAKALTENLKLEEELKYIEDRRGKLYFIFRTKSVPFEYIGDGAKIVFVIYAICSYLSEGLILIEEPEVHQHPKSLELIAESIAYSAKSNQIFIATHSLEFLEMLLKNAKKENVNLNVYKLIELKDGELRYKLYSRDVAYASIKDIGRDLRI